MAIEQEHLDRYLVLAYAMSCAAVVVLLPSGHVRSWLQAGIAFALQIVVGLLLVFEPRLEHGRYRWLGVAGIAASLTSVALL